MTAEVISIGAINNIDFIKARLDQEAEILAKEGLTIDWQEDLIGKFTFINCNINNFQSAAFSDKDAGIFFKQYIANIISEIIINKWEKIILSDIIKENYFYFSEKERKIIYEHALKQIENGDIDYITENIYQVPRKNQILEKLQDFFYNNNKIVIEGFIKFRLKEYLNDLNEIADRAVDDYLLEREHKEFIRLLKFFVEAQEPKIELIHVIVKSNSSFQLLDNEKNPVEKEYLDGLLYDISEGQINYDDLLVSALITIAPKEIIIHSTSDGSKGDYYDTITDIFEGRVTFCRDCGICKDIKN